LLLEVNDECFEASELLVLSEPHVGLALRVLRINELLDYVCDILITSVNQYQVGLQWHALCNQNKIEFGLKVLSIVDI